MFQLRRKYRPINSLLIDADALRSNFDLYAKRFVEQKICPVLKSNAYGHGLVEVSKILKIKRPAYLIVDSMYEAFQLYKSGIRSPILILGYTFPENLASAKKNFHFCFSDLVTAKHLARLKIPAHLEIDTGMKRMGAPMEELPTFLKALKKTGIRLEGVFTHLADADNPKDSFTDHQTKEFSDAVDLVYKAGFNPKWIHIGASAGALKIKDPRVNMIRLGLALYGVSPLSPKDPYNKELKGLKPALTLKTHLISVRTVHKGETVSYGRTYTAPKTMMVGTIPIGYYEALPRSLSNKDPFLGLICMNHAILKVSPNAKIGDPILLFSGDFSTQKLADRADLSPYELLTGIDPSIRREVV